MATALAIPARDPEGHKGTFGNVAVMGGCAGGRVRMVGAPALAARAALRSGCGLARIYGPEPVILSVLSLAPEATGRAIAVDAEGHPDAAACVAALDEAARDAHAVVLGPGMGPSAGLREAVEHALRLPARAAPIVLDADGLNMLAEVPRPRLTRFSTRVVLTPHVGEFRRVQAALGLHRDPEREAPAAAQDVARELGCVVVLKAHRTVIADGLRVVENTTGNAALATAGSGDVLAGIIGGLLAQFAARATRPDGPALDVLDLAALGVAVHAAAGDRWRAVRGADAGLLASDLLDLIPAEIQARRSPGRTG